MSFHNLPASRDTRIVLASDEFNCWLTAAVDARPAEQEQALIEWAKAPSVRLCHPPRGEEYLLPLMVAARRCRK